MGDRILETVVKVVWPKSMKVKKFLLVFITVMLFLLDPIFPFIIIAGAIMLAVTVYMFRNWNIQYEYVLSDGELTFAKIIAKDNRKILQKINLREAIELISYKEYSLRQDKGEKIKIIDYSSRENIDNAYILKVYSDGRLISMIFEPTYEMLIESRRYVRRTN